MKIHNFARLERATQPGGEQKISKEELAMLYAAGNVNNLFSSSVPATDTVTYTDEPTHFSTEGTQTPEEEMATEIANRVLGRVERGEGDEASPR